MESVFYWGTLNDETVNFDWVDEDLKTMVIEKLLSIPMDVPEDGESWTIKFNHNEITYSAPASVTTSMIVLNYKPPQQVIEAVLSL